MRKTNFLGGYRQALLGDIDSFYDEEQAEFYERRTIRLCYGEHMRLLPESKGEEEESDYAQELVKKT